MYFKSFEFKTIYIQFPINLQSVQNQY